MLLKRPLYCLLMAIIPFIACQKENHQQKEQIQDLTLTPAEQERAQADNSFAFKMFKELAADAGTQKNLIFSPLSISTAVAMVSNGANGDTHNEIRTALEFNGATEDDVNSYYNKLMTRLPQLDSRVTMKIANSVWVNDKVTPKEAFINVQKKSYLAGIQSLDFSNPNTKQTINNWIAEKTNDKIKDLIKEIEPGVIMYLINAIYFKSDWKYKFDKSKTAKSAFTTASGQNVQADFMQAKVVANITHNSMVNIYELPYGNDKYSMVLLVPEAGKSVMDVINTTDTATWASWMNNLHPGEITIQLPKFSLEYKKSIIPELEKMGMKLAFVRQKADFKRIASLDGIYISGILHAATIDVDEKGSEAAAVTVVVASITSADQSIVSIKKPFIFAIREMESGIIVFGGILNNPTLK